VNSHKYLEPYQYNPEGTLLYLDNLWIHRLPQVPQVSLCITQSIEWAVQSRLLLSSLWMCLEYLLVPVSTEEDRIRQTFTQKVNTMFLAQCKLCFLIRDGHFLLFHFTLVSVHRNFHSTWTVWMYLYDFNCNVLVVECMNWYKMLCKYTTFWIFFFFFWW
jgi:hypothetical protein